MMAMVDNDDDDDDETARYYLVGPDNEDGDGSWRSVLLVNIARSIIKSLIYHYLSLPSVNSCNFCYL